MSALAEIPNAFAGWLPLGEPLDGARLPWLRAAREQALGRVRALGIPTAKDEGWRYTGLRALAEQPFVPVTDPIGGVGAADLDGHLVPGLDTHRAVLVDGRWVPSLSQLDGLPVGVRAGSLRALLAADPGVLEGRLNRVAGEGAHVFAALNTAGFDDGLVLIIERGVVLDKPLELIQLSTAAEGPRVVQPRHLVVIAAGAQATLIERYLGQGFGAYCTNSLVEVSLEAEARLRHYRIQIEGTGAFHLSGVYLRQAGGSGYQGVDIGLGAAWARTDRVVRFSGPHAECDLKGLYLAGDRQLLDYHLDVAHGVPQCTSRETYKGILYGRGRAVLDGRVLVALDAQKSDAHLSNKNLLLSREAEVDTKPQLEILADDVRCSHGTTVGQIEPELLFYLRARGIPAPLARRMLCLGFAEEIIDALDPEPLRDYLTEQVGERLERAPMT